MIGIVDYGVGNLFSLKSSLKYLNADCIVTSDADLIYKCDKVILPGVGAFADARKKLSELGLDECVCELAKRGTSILGICLGMQLLFDKSYEYGEHKGLGLVPGQVKLIETKSDLKIPHIGWNALSIKENEQVFKYISNGSHVYFVHSYYATDCLQHTIATTEYGISLTAAVRNENVIGMQFHPEKSGGVGLNILRAFIE